MTDSKPMRAELVDDYRIKCALLLEEVIDAEEAAKLAAAEIAELRAERDRLKAALEKISNAQRRTDRLVPIERSDGLVDWLEVHAFARKALGDAS
jgi:hypothetical protein